MINLLNPSKEALIIAYTKAKKSQVDPDSYTPIEESGRLLSQNTPERALEVAEIMRNDFPNETYFQRVYELIKNAFT
jgi:hypothetical protein